MHIILVGDSVLSPAKMQEYLEESRVKASVISCATGSGAAEAAAAHSRVVAIAHMNLPGGEHGFHVLQQVKEVKGDAITILIMRSGLYRELEQAIHGEVDHVFGVPLRRQRFRDCLRNASRVMEDREDLVRRKEVYRKLNRVLVKHNPRKW